MDFFSTRHPNKKVSLSEAIQSGLASDGGLFVPAYFPKMALDSFSPNLSYPEFSEKVLEPYFKDDALYPHLSTICQNAFTFPVPLHQVSETDYLLELFHGPTLSFKDFGARFLAECLTQLHHSLTIMVATSGDTGSAVASAFHNKNRINIVILYPLGLISARQEYQITCWGDNIIALGVKGTFDDCQRLVKTAFLDPEWRESFHLSSANSINIGRLLPQITYYAFHSMAFFRKHKKPIGLIVPTGNLGHATAAYFAKLMGFPIREIVIATNANRAIPDYLQSGVFEPRPSIATLANAMDVGNPSNFERMQFLFPDFNYFKENVKTFSATDEDIRETIKSIYEKYKLIIDPHTATAFYARHQLSGNEPWIVVSTADPCKFEEIIEPLLGVEVPLPPQMQLLLNKPSIIQMIPPELSAIHKILLEKSSFAMK